MEFLSVLWLPILLSAAAVFIVSSIIHMAHSGGVDSLVLEPRELLRRLAALVPAPYTHLVRYPCVSLLFSPTSLRIGSCRVAIQARVLSGTRLVQFLTSFVPAAHFRFSLARDDLRANVIVRRFRAVTRFSPGVGSCACGSPNSSYTASMVRGT